MFKGWVELFDRFIESFAKTYDSRESGIFEIARHACGMVVILIFVMVVISFQAVMTYFDYASLKEDYTELNLAYLRHSDVFYQVNDRLGGLERNTAELHDENEQLLKKMGILYDDNVALNHQLFLCLNPKWKPPSSR